MLVNLYSIFDKVAEESGPIFQAKNDGVAMRQYQQLLQQNAQVNLDDYQLMCLGSFNTGTVVLVSHEAPVIITPMKGMEVSDEK